MQAVIIIVFTLSVVVFLLHRRVEIGHAMFAGSLLIQVLTLSAPEVFFRAAAATFRSSNTWEILIALYFVMCLEFQLRTSGLLDELMSAAREHFFSDKVLLAGMPAFLGLLPSMGGALFSAPMVENASRSYALTSENKATINYWFRHVWEFSNPILPSLLLVGELTHIPVGDLVGLTGWFTLAAVGIGWIICLSRIPGKESAAEADAVEAVPACGPSCQTRGVRAVILTSGPILLNIILVVVFHLAASVSMTTVVVLMALVLRQNKENVLKMLRHGLDRKLLWGVGSVLLFQYVLQETKVLTDVVALSHAINVPVLVVSGILAFVTGVLTGTATGFVAISMPIIVALAPGNVPAIVVGFVCGTAGQMLSPMHLCLLVTLQYFKADFARTMAPVLAMEVAMVALVSLWFGF